METTHEHPHHEHVPEQPKKKPVISLPAAILSGAVIVALAIVFAFGQKPAATAPQTAAQDTGTPTSVPADVAKLRSSDYVRGNKDAAVLVIEYSDSDCPFCQRFHSVIDQTVKDSNGSAAWVYRYFPLDMHPNAYTEAIALECVGELGGNGAFQNYLDGIINVTYSPDPTSNKNLIEMATKQGISESALTACLKGKSAVTRVDGDLAEGSKIGVRGTPFNIVVNQMTGKQVILPGAYPIDALKDAIKSVQ